MVGSETYVASSIERRGPISPCSPLRSAGRNDAGADAARCEGKGTRTRRVSRVEARPRVRDWKERVTARDAATGAHATFRLIVRAHGWPAAPVRARSERNGVVVDRTSSSATVVPFEAPRGASVTCRASAAFAGLAIFVARPVKVSSTPGLRTTPPLASPSVCRSARRDASDAPVYRQRPLRGREGGGRILIRGGVGVRRAAKRELRVFSAALDIPDRLRHVNRGRAGYCGKIGRVSVPW